MREKGVAPLLIIAILSIITIILVAANRWSESKYKEQQVRVNELKQSPTSTASHTRQSTSDDAQFIDSIYRNEKYNFKLKYQSKYVFKGKTESVGWIEENGNQIIYKDKDLDSNRITIEEKYTIYDVNQVDKTNITKWWSENIKNDVDGGKVPTDYIVEEDVGNYVWHPDNPLKHWDSAPPGIIVYLNEPAAQKIIDREGYYMPGYSVYLYYNFTTPFIINFTAGNTGAGTNPGILSYIERLN